ncbi:MAG: membrane protein insertase YidC [Corynebacterium camporealensis]|uniref:membrane protein insertase YidC n=1 Tax=Corynebacterium camporealensis TaxID=161896 RepID=UPI002A91C617|nr:membrane protein insertase YidC [Corynebacterium camporealensis]MDY5839411.1 membrane protein insertase YidC [Corynebacterium camporealensis]
MLEIFMYPVSGIMKLWHMLTQSFVNDSLAWLITIVLLVLTVRTLVAPLNWVSVRSGRIGALLRPRIVKFDEREQAAETPEEMADILREKNALFKEYNYRPLVGCLPIFITLPVLIGLYQLLIRMARTDMPDNYGLLNDEEVAAFRATIFQDIPITDFAKDHTDLVIPLLVAALLFTVATSAISVYRSYLTMQFDKKVNRRVFWFTLALLFLIPILLWNIAFSGPIPVAIILYWGCTYLYTLLQTITFEVILRKRYPLPEEVHELRRESIRKWRAKIKPEKATPEERKALSRLRVDANKILREEKKNNPNPQPKPDTDSDES